MDELRVHLEFAKILALVVVISILLTIIVYFIFRKNIKYRLARYIPGLLLLLIGLYNIMNLGIELPAITEFNKVLIIVISMIGSFISFSTGLIIGIVNKQKKD